MMPGTVDYRALRQIRQRERDQVLNSLNIKEEKEIIQQECIIQQEIVIKQECFEEVQIIRKPVTRSRRQTLQFPVKKWFSPRRSSLRNFKQNENKSLLDESYFDSDYSSSSECKSKKPKRPNTYGQIEGIYVGDCWETRIECSHDGIHRPTVAGIHPGPEGAYSVALSAGYEDDLDNGEVFTYTGSGGRDLRGTKANRKNLRTAPQSKDQTAEGANKSLIISMETKNPVRVIRGYKLTSGYAPEQGYRYDGLYIVEDYWKCRGLAGFQVYKFLMKRIDDQPPAPWTKEFEQYRTRVETMKTRRMTDWKSNGTNELAVVLQPVR